MFNYREEYDCIIFYFFSSNPYVDMFYSFLITCIEDKVVSSYNVKHDYQNFICGGDQHSYVVGCTFTVRGYTPSFKERLQRFKELLHLTSQGN